jgi:hypothetical protein
MKTYPEEGEQDYWELLCSKCDKYSYSWDGDFDFCQYCGTKEEEDNNK